MRRKIVDRKKKERRRQDSTVKNANVGEEKRGPINSYGDGNLNQRGENERQNDKRGEL